MGKAVKVSENNSWGTPDEIFEYFDAIYNFKFDLAASEQNKKCSEFFSEKDNSLIQDWHRINGWLWLNPPYGRNLKLWIKKAHEEMEKGAMICMLIPASVGTLYWHEYIINRVNKIYFFKGRIQFITQDNKKMAGAMYDSALVEFQKVQSKRTIIESASLKDIYEHQSKGNLSGEGLIKFIGVKIR